MEKRKKVKKLLNKYIDHTLLRPDATEKQIDQLIAEAVTYDFYSVCINPAWVSYCHEKLEGTDIKVCTVVGFPLGATTTEVKEYETKQAIQNGADEIDMVINIGALKANDQETVKNDMKRVVHAAGQTALVKVIIETVLLSDEEKVIACQLAKEAKADFVKTSTGFSGGGATVGDIQQMRKTVGPSIGVKASGGIRKKEKALEMIQAGATRIGASAGADLLV